jgi:hypothetical protein
MVVAVVAKTVEGGGDRKVIRLHFDQKDISDLWTSWYLFSLE